MQNRVPVPRSERPALPEFAPVPRKYRHDGWTPERQKAFIEALADTGCVSRAAKQVNISQQNAYALRRAPGAEEFRKAWDAALDFGLKRLKDIAFERAIEGYLVPVFVGGRLVGFRRKHNDALLIFCLRHYGQDADGKRTTINYFSTRASAGAVSAPSSGAAASGAEASATTVRTVITGAGEGPGGAGGAEEAAAVLSGFEGVALDPQAAADIAAALEACAARAREAQEACEAGGVAEAQAATEDREVPFVHQPPRAAEWDVALEPPVATEYFEPFTPGESMWELAGAQVPEDLLRFEAELAQRRAEAPAEEDGEATGPGDEGG
jgi:hypothetical protein